MSRLGPDPMDQFSAHLDRGWDLVSRGDTRGAMVSARRALELDPNSPEVYNLLGYISAADGDADDALEHYRQAMALDDGYMEPILNAAELLVHPLHDFDEAVALCDDALSFAEDPEEIADAKLLKFDALMGKGDHDGARGLLGELPEGPFENPGYTYLIGRAYYEIGNTEAAKQHIGEAVERDPRNADARYYLGLILEESGDLRGATEAFLAARQLDLEAPPPPWSPPRDHFERVVEKALGLLPAELGPVVDGALVIIGDVPGIEVVADGVDPRSTVLVEGLHREPREPSEKPDAPIRLFCYQRCLERHAASLAELEDLVVESITHELSGGDHDEPVAPPEDPSRSSE